MENLNVIIVEGNLTADPEKKQTRSHKSICTFQIAVNHREHGDQKPVSYISIETWGQTADNCATYLRKGASVTVRGSIKQDRWEDQDGKKQSTIKVVAENVRFNPSRKKDITENESPPPFRGYGSAEEDPNMPF